MPDSRPANATPSPGEPSLINRVRPPSPVGSDTGMTSKAEVLFSVEGRSRTTPTPYAESRSRELFQQPPLRRACGLRPSPGGAAALQGLGEDVARGGRAVERAQLAAPDLPAFRRSRELPAVGEDAVDAVAGRDAVVGQFALRAPGVRVEKLQVGGDEGPIAVELDVRQPGEVGEAAFDRLLVRGPLGDGGDGLVSERVVETLAPVEDPVLVKTARV